MRKLATVQYTIAEWQSVARVNNGHHRIESGGNDVIRRHARQNNENE
jgi:hypothetical protein